MYNKNEVSYGNRALYNKKLLALHVRRWKIIFNNINKIP
jgi:hypothetical protein